MLCYFQEIITKILNYCQSYVAKKQSNLTNWHPILGWFKQSTDERWVITLLLVCSKYNKRIIADAMLTPLLCHRNISWWQWYYASSHLLQGGPYCRVDPTAGWALLQGGPYGRVGPTAGWALRQGGPYGRVGPTAGWALLQGGPYCSLGSGVLRSVHSLVPHPTKTQFKIQAIMTEN